MKHIIPFLLLILLISCNQPNPQKESHPKIDTAYNKNFIQKIDSLQHTIKIIDSLLKEKESYADLWHKRGQVYLNLNKKDSAIISFEKALRINKYHTETLLALGYIYAEDGNKKCITTANHLITFNPNDILIKAKANYILGVYNVIIQQDKEAITYFDKCIKQDWTFIEAYLEKGVLLFKIKDYTQALKIFILATKVNNKNAESYYWVGRTLEELKNINAAKKYYKQALLLNSNLEVAKKRLKKIETK